MGAVMWKAAIVLGLAGQAAAHITMWNEALFGFNWPFAANSSSINYNNNAAVAPLRQRENRSIDEWFAHGWKNYTPVAGKYMYLPSGGNLNAELSCNRAYTSFRNPGQTGALMEYACTTTGPLHNANKFGEALNVSLFGGTALAIAYTSDVEALQPSDMTVISINYTSPWTRETIYQIPSGLPTCPSGGCLCTWNWIHQQNHGEGYGQEIYNNLYRCMVNGTTNDANQLATPQAANYCDGNKSNCTTGAKQPMYLWMAEGNNMDGRLGPTFPNQNPTYNERYGWSDGAQTDIFTTGNGTSSHSSADVSATPSTAAVLLAATLAGLASLASSSAGSVAHVAKLAAATAATPSATASVSASNAAADAESASSGHHRHHTYGGGMHGGHHAGLGDLRSAHQASRTAIGSAAAASASDVMGGLRQLAAVNLVANTTDSASASAASASVVAASDSSCAPGALNATGTCGAAPMMTTMPGGTVCVRRKRSVKRDEL